ncbi:MAG: biopolymer transporter ExbD [Proteobacteria bacterium]|nr:biopolymer transporter ExbD [Pseudomonadota bacterium]
MGFSLTPGGERRPVAEINMIPLIDVMLVLLVIFIVAAPLLTHAVRVELPRAASAPTPPRPDAIRLGLTADGQLFWNGQAISSAELETRLGAAGRLDPVPELHLQADAAAPYGAVARSMATASRQGVSRIGFVSDPRPEAR